MAKSKMICITGKKALHKLNESAGSGRYILEGVFAELDKLNRNSRIYTKEEYLKHLQYLRDDIRKGEPLLGELDHPEDRFEVKLKEASHRIIDIWYDQAKNVVMGKIELLNTPNGKLAQSIVDQGIPLHISSRAAGTVNSDNTVSIQQIYTYDLVCKPGFAGAVLHRVNESAGSYSKDVMGFLHKSNTIESLNEAVNYGLAKENIAISDVNSEVTLRKEALDIIKENNTIRNIMKKKYTLNEADDFADIFGDMNDNTDEKDEKKDAEEKGDEKDDKKDDEDGVEILSISPEYASDSDSDSEKSDDKDENGEESEDETEENSSDDKEDDSAEECDKRSKEADPKDALLDDEKQTKEQKEVIKKLDDIIDGIKKGASDSKKKDECDGAKCESLLYAQYPISRSLNESNFAQFAALNEEQKTKVTAYLQDRGIYAPKMINEMWKNGIDYNATEPVWLKYAPAKYKALYNEAPQMVKESLANTAEYLVFESQRDVNMFWENSGLETKAEMNKRNKAFTENLPKINESATANNANLPYSVNLINAVVEMASAYN